MTSVTNSRRHGRSQSTGAHAARTRADGRDVVVVCSAEPAGSRRTGTETIHRRETHTAVACQGKLATAGSTQTRVGQRKRGVHQHLFGDPRPRGSHKTGTGRHTHIYISRRTRRSNLLNTGVSQIHQSSFQNRTTRDPGATPNFAATSRVHQRRPLYSCTKDHPIQTHWWTTAPSTRLPARHRLL